MQLRARMCDCPRYCPCICGCFDGGAEEVEREAKVCDEKEGNKDEKDLAVDDNADEGGRRGC